MELMINKDGILDGEISSKIIESAKHIDAQSLLRFLVPENTDLVCTNCDAKGLIHYKGLGSYSGVVVCSSCGFRL